MRHRAFTPEDKRARRLAILDAARALFAAGDGALPAAAEIAEAAGLAKGTLFLYFPTKEAVFLALWLEGWSVVLRDVAAVLRAAEGGRDARVAAFVAGYADHLARDATAAALLRLDALGFGVLERNVAPATRREVRATFLGRLVEVGRLVDAAFRLPPGRGAQLLTRTYALTRGVWQVTAGCVEALAGDAAGAPPPDAAALAAPLASPEFPCPDFDTELRDTLHEYWRGALASQPRRVRTAT